MTSLGGGATTTIPTISAAVSSSNLSAKSRNNSNDALNSSSNNDNKQNLTTKQILQQKFKENENVLSVCILYTYSTYICMSMCILFYNIIFAFYY